MLPPLKSYDFEVGASCSIALQGKAKTGYPRVSRAVPIADLRGVQGTVLLDGTAPEFSLCPEADAIPAAGR